MRAATRLLTCACAVGAGVLAATAPVSAAVYAGAGTVPFDFVYGGGTCFLGETYNFDSAGAFADSTGATYSILGMQWQVAACSGFPLGHPTSWNVAVNIGPCAAAGQVADDAGILVGDFSGTCSVAGSVLRVVITGEDDGSALIGTVALEADVVS